MNTWMLAGTVLVALIFLLKFIFAGSGKVMKLSYQKRDFLFTPDERAFLVVLDEAVGEAYRIFGKIPVTDIISPRTLERDAEARKTFDGLENRRFSFVICDKLNLSVVCVLQLDESMPGHKGRKGGDPLQNLCEGAGLPLIRVSAQALPDPKSMSDLILSSARRDPLFSVESDGRREPRFSNFDNLDL